MKTRTGWTNATTFSPDGKRLAVGTESGICIFILPLQDVIAMAKSRLTRELKLAECQQHLHLDTCPTRK